jgi:hypothetical protein
VKIGFSLRIEGEVGLQGLHVGSDL